MSKLTMSHKEFRDSLEAIGMLGANGRSDLDLTHQALTVKREIVIKPKRTGR